MVTPRLDRLTAVEPLLQRFDDAATRLATIDVPMLRGRARALDDVALTMRVLGRDVEHGAALLESSGIDPESVRQVREASRALGSRPLMERHVHGAARALTDAVADVRMRNAQVLSTAAGNAETQVASAREILAGIDGQPTSEQRASLAAALQYDPRLDRFANARLHDRLLETVPMQAKVSLLRDMVQHPAGELQPDEARLLGRLVQGRNSGRTGGILASYTNPPYSSSLDEAINGVIEGTNPRRAKELDRFFARDIVTRMPEGERLELATKLFSKDVSDLDQREWNLLEQLTNGDVVGYDTGLITHMDGHEGLSRHIAFRTMQGLPPSDSMYAYFDANALKGVANAERAKIVQARFEAALDEAASGSLSKSAQTLLTASWPAVANRVSWMPIERQSAIAMTLLGLPSGPSGDLSTVRGALHAIDQDLAAMTVPTQFEDLYAQTKVLIDRNIGRMEGRHDPSAVRGYSIHPDYAEVGQIRANGVLLRAVRDMAERKPAAPVPSEAPAAADAGPAVEQLTW